MSNILRQFSGGEHCDGFDGAADDIIAFLNVIEETEDRADVQRTTVRGGSRGATVALLVAERDKRVKGAIGVARAGQSFKANVSK
jgi:dipeptidyl aminopeptidase/acylaminoacyl peptidase